MNHAIGDDESTSPNNLSSHSMDLEDVVSHGIILCGSLLRLLQCPVSVCTPLPKSELFTQIVSLEPRHMLGCVCVAIDKSTL